MDLNQPFVSCSICHTHPPDQRGQELYLTSCAHIICHKHATKGESFSSSLENIKISCPVCGHDYVSLVKLDQNLPSEIHPFFTPFPNQIEQLFAAAQFQYCALADKINNQSQLVERLVQKINKQKSLLLLAKDKIGQVESLERKVENLEKENYVLKSNSNSRLQDHRLHRPETIDLTDNDSMDSLPGMDQRKVVTRSFVNQIKQSSTQRSVPLGSKRSHLQSFDLSKGKMAESTNILNNPPIKSITNKNMQNMRESSHGISTPTSHSSHRLMSNDSFNSTLSSKTPEPFLPPILSTNTNNMKANSRKAIANRLSEQGRVSKNRAATSQIAQRLSAHMKIGTATPSAGLRVQTSNGARPGSSFNQRNIFKKR